MNRHPKPSGLPAPDALRRGPAAPQVHLGHRGCRPVHLCGLVGRGGVQGDAANAGEGSVVALCRAAFDAWHASPSGDPDALTRRRQNAQPAAGTRRLGTRSTSTFWWRRPRSCPRRSRASTRRCVVPLLGCVVALCAKESGQVPALCAWWLEFAALEPEVSSEPACAGAINEPSPLPPGPQL